METVAEDRDEVVRWSLRENRVGQQARCGRGVQPGVEVANMFSRRASGEATLFVAGRLYRADLVGL